MPRVDLLSIMLKPQTTKLPSKGLKRTLVPPRVAIKNSKFFFVRKACPQIPL